MAGGPAERRVGRYVLFDVIASGGMAQVLIGRLLGPVGFARTVAVKSLHPRLALDADFVSMFVDEARLAARIRHPNVVSTLDVITHGRELHVVMEYVHGESLARLARALVDGRFPARFAVSIMIAVLHGLHAAHEATDDLGAPLGIVHRDVSPQNIIVGVDGVARVLDFGVAKAASNAHTTQQGKIKGKAAYMAPEQISGGAVDRRVDIFAAGIVLWEMLTGDRMFKKETPEETMVAVHCQEIEPPGRRVDGLPPRLDDVILRALARNPSERFATAREMAIALEGCAPAASPREIGEWVETIAGDSLSARADVIARVERTSTSEGTDDGELPTDTRTARPLGREETVPTYAHLHSPSGANPAVARAWLLVAALGLTVTAIVRTTVSGRSAQPTSAPSAPAAAPLPTSEAVDPSTTASAAPPPAPTSELPAKKRPRPAPVKGHPSSEATGTPAPSALPSTRSSGVVGCDPKFTIDELGVKRFKPECL